jgi:heavy metal sensor kinase
MKPLSLRGRLTVWYTLTLFVVLLLFGAQVLWHQGRIGLRRVDRELAELTATVVNVLRDEIRESAPAPAQEAIDTIGPRGPAIAILDARGRPLASAWNGLTLPASIAERFPSEQDDDRGSTVDTASGAWRVHARTERSAAGTFIVVAGRPLSDVLRERREAQEAMAIAIPIALLLAGLGGWWLAAIGLRPITSMASRAAAIPLAGMDDLGESDRADELGQLARAFNGLVARLRTALQTQRQFMADASHELRTPVSVIRSAADVTLGRDHRDEPEYREALSIVGDQARRVTHLVDDMLVLARADTGGYPLQRAPLYLDDLVGDCRRTIDVLAAERGVAVRASPSTELPLVGDENLLRRMLLNVVQNAVQHTPSGGGVTIAVVPNGRTVAIEVTNDGEAIPPADRERIFDRFVQLDPSRRACGAGLGLPIARWIAEAHGGTLVLKTSSAAGTTFAIALPLS